MNPETSLLEHRLLFLPTTAWDGATTAALMAPLGIHVAVYRTFETLLEEIGRGAGAILLPEEAASIGHNAQLRDVLARQPPWSDLPVLVLTRPGADSARSIAAVQTLGNVTLLERPIRQATLVTAVQTAIRARARQYQLRQYLEDRARAEVSLRTADQRKDEFLATLGHELRNPLAPLRTALQLLQARGAGDPVTLRVQAVMDRQIDHLVRLVNDLLEVSRITRGLIEVRRDPIDLAVVVHSAVDTSRPVVEAANHRLTIDLPDRALTVLGDTVRLTQVFANLLTNAAKYTPDGGAITIRAAVDDGRVAVSVKDNGIGVPSEQLDSVFEMFTQVDRSNRHAQGGLGIGLTLVRSLVSMHGGHVEAHSEGPGRGSEFIVTLPLVAGPATGERRPPVPGPFPPRRILIVDDNQDAADTLGELLGSLGAMVSVVHNGRDAIAALDEFEPDALLLDIGMPDMDGYDVARAIRSLRASPHPLLIALTGWGQEHDQQRSRAAGFDHHVVKPPDIEELRRLLSVGWEETRPSGHRVP